MGLSNSQFDAIMREYDKRRLNQAAKLDAKLAQVYEMIPEYSDVEEEIREIAFQAGLKSIAGDTEALAKMHEEIEILSKKKEELLVANGFAKDFLEPEYICKDCKDTGYIDGKKCHCLSQKILQILYSKSNVGSILEKENFDTLSMDEYTDSEYEIMKPIVDRCKAYVTDFDNSKENILFMGKPGVGKTFLSNCIAKALLDSGHSVIYFTSVQLFDTLSRVAFSYDYSEDSQGMKDDIYMCDLLIVDDLGTESSTKFVEAQLFNIINERIIRDKSTIISTNLMLSDITERYSERVLSRLVGKYTMIKPDISDIRFKNKISSQGR
ncbi:MAG: ATP-binding protein [Lachnospiraceae bacterium]|nr:ATP-binding protein [Lachnospiraceae bacterium]